MQFLHFLFYVADSSKSTALYRRLLNAAPVQSTPHFALFALPDGGTLALWSRAEVAPRATLPGGSELGFAVASPAEVRRTRDAWVKLGLHIIQEPVLMPFGFTFTAADPDGHRLRVVAPN